MFRRAAQPAGRLFKDCWLADVPYALEQAELGCVPLVNIQQPKNMLRYTRMNCCVDLYYPREKVETVAWISGSRLADLSYGGSSSRREQRRRVIPPGL